MSDSESEKSANPSPPSPPHSPKADDGDFLGYGTYADTLWARINRSLQKDADGKTKLGDDPLVVGIFGEWGAGKSKLLSLVQKRAEAQSRRDISERVLSATSGNPMTVTVPVYFQPWKYEHERHLHVPLAVHIADALKETWKKLPTDIEKLKTGLKAAGELTAETEKKLEAAKGVWDKGLELWGSVKSVVNSNVGGFVAGATDAVLVSTGVPPMASIARKKIIEGMASDDAEEEGDEGEGADDEKPKAKAATKHDGAKTKADKPKKLGFAYKDDGLGFYRLHKHLRALTRPKLGQKALEDAGITVTQGIEFDLRINFVVFIDDLDRCLPEKAVETLELIKTIFNTESFAFVLALDEEVVERGIGHRYKDYALKDKKPEMPITGFEYLEKIVHLPFRLPALSRGQALHFMAAYERKNLLAGGRDPWFVAREVGNDLRGKSGELEALSGAGRGSTATSSKLHLGKLVINSFDAHVPRKLVRIMELFHQVLDVLPKQGKSLALGGQGGAFDERLVLALLLLQLFHPDLYRTLKRTGFGFDLLRDEFVAGKLRADISDIDLLHWAAYGSAAEAPTEVEKAVAQISILPFDSRHPAQRVRLPIVERLLSHRAAQRHVFDSLKLFAELKASHDVVALPKESSQAYFGLLADATFDATDPGLFALEPAQAAAPISAQDKRPRQSVSDVQGLFARLTSAEDRERESAAEAAGLQAGAVLDEKSATALLAMYQAWIGKREGNTKRLLQSLRYIAPHIAKEQGGEFWAMLQGLEHGGAMGAPFENTQQINARALWADVRTALGCDDRFDAGNFYLLKAKPGAKDADKWMASFVHIPKDDDFLLGEGNGVAAPIASDFYIAKTLITVDQYACFVNEGGYKLGEDIWDAEGIRWRNNDFNSRSNLEGVRNRLARRDASMRAEPMNWPSTTAFGSRPVTDVTWFEARAYARWLNTKLKTQLNSRFDGYEVRLPTEAQWERAARAKDARSADARRWPWGDDEKDAHLRANIDKSGLGESSVVGLFPESAIGLCDVSGNLWEWQDNLYTGEQQSEFSRIAPKHPFKIGEDLNTADTPARRGGSWIHTAAHARCGSRDGNRPGSWFNFVGFRVVLSLA